MMVFLILTLTMNLIIILSKEKTNKLRIELRPIMEKKSLNLLKLLYFHV